MLGNEEINSYFLTDGHQLVLPCQKRDFFLKDGKSTGLFRQAKL